MKDHLELKKNLAVIYEKDKLINVKKYLIVFENANIIKYIIIFAKN